MFNKQKHCVYTVNNKWITSHITLTRYKLWCRPNKIVNIPVIYCTWQYCSKLKSSLINTWQSPCKQNCYCARISPGWHNKAWLERITTDGWYRADSRFAPNQWETALLCNDVSHCLGASLESVLWYIAKTMKTVDGSASKKVALFVDLLCCITNFAFISTALNTWYERLFEPTRIL